MEWTTLSRMAARLLGGGAVLGIGALIAGCAVDGLSPRAQAEGRASAPAAAAVATLVSPVAAAQATPADGTLATPATDAQAFPAALASADDAAPRALRPPRQDGLGLRTSFADIVEPAMASVVSIESQSRRQQRGPFGMPFGGAERPDQSFGSGVIVRSDGIILTNNHVVEGGEDVRVRLQDNRELRARVLGTDPATDLAVLKVEGKDLPALPLGTSSDLRVGDVVFAIGSPFALSQSVTMGIVSATGRSKVGITDEGYEDFIQTDAPINPGNSGGALVDSRGEVIGINTAIFTNGMIRGNQGIGFAVPVDLVRNVMDQILADGRVVRSQLGVRIKEVDAALAKSYGLSAPRGALVTGVVPGSPADVAGLRAEDLIVEVDGRSVTSDSQLRLDISSRRPGTQVQVAVLRESDGGYDKRTVAATLRELAEREDEPERVIGAVEDRDNALRGVAVENLGEVPPADRRRLGLADTTSGVIVTSVDPFSPAARAGIRPGDVITAVDRRPVGDTSEFRDLASELGKDVVRLRIQRRNEADIVAVEP